MSMVSKRAPQFEMEGVSGGRFGTFRSEDYRGKWIVLFFYPLAFPFGCPTELQELRPRAAVPGRGKGVAQDWPILAHAPALLTPTMGARTISVCDLGDAVCDYDPDAEDDMNPAAVAMHTSYARNAAAMDAWTAPLFRLVQSRPVAVPDANPMQVAAGS